MAASAVAAADVDKVYDKGGLLFKVWEGVTTEADTVVFTHGGPAAPDFVLCTLDSADPVDSGLSVTAKAATTFTVDCEDDGNDTFTAVAVWFHAASTDAPSP